MKKFYYIPDQISFHMVKLNVFRGSVNIVKIFCKWRHMEMMTLSLDIKFWTNKLKNKII